jgi:hypothetical protein
VLLVAQARQRRSVGGESLAAAREEGLERGLEAFEHDRLDRDVLGAEVVGHVLFVGGARLRADGGVLELLGARHLELLRHQETLAVVVGDGREVEAQRSITRQRPGGVAREDVDFAGLQGREALLRIERHEVDFFRIAQHGGGDGAAGVHVQARPVALRIGCGKAGHAVRHAAFHGAALLDGVEGFAGEGWRSGCKRDDGRGNGQRGTESTLHWCVLLNNKQKAVYGAARYSAKERTVECICLIGPGPGFSCPRHIH